MLRVWNEEKQTRWTGCFSRSLEFPSFSLQKHLGMFFNELIARRQINIGSQFPVVTAISDRGQKAASN